MEANKIKQQLFNRFYNNLNERQRDAVYTVNGPLLVLAGAGSGKTTVLVNRIAHILRFGNAYASSISFSADDEATMQKLLKSGSHDDIGAFLENYAVSPCDPAHVLCITFTNKAASEFKDRLKMLLGDQASKIWAGTFHSICVRILRRNITLLGYGSDFTIYDSDDTRRMLTQIMRDQKLDDKVLPVRSVAIAISKAKEACILPDQFDREADNLRARQIADVYTEYQKRLKQASALDFDDIILNTILLFREHPDVLAMYRRVFDYILVDEYQDTNPSQNDLVIALGKGKENVCVVGDDDQSIYSFRGATVQNILDFDKSFPGLKTIKLEQNYRSTKTILDAANAVIANNTDRKGKNLWTEGGEGKKITAKCLYTQVEEGEYILETIRSLVGSGNYSYHDIAVLYRVNALSNAVETSFARGQVPYRVFGGTRFFDRREIKDIVAYLAVIANPNDDVRLRRIINVPKRQIGDATVENVAALAEREGVSIFTVLREASAFPELARSATRLEHFYALVADLTDFASENAVSALVEEVIRRTGYREMLEQMEEKDKIELINELVSSAVQYEESNEEPTLSGFLEDVSLVADTDTYDEDADTVTLMTVHSSKGLEFPVVFIAGFEEGVFPSAMSVGEGNIEEERRLAYVAITRAKKELYLTYTQSRLLYGFTAPTRASSFYAEIPKELIEFEEQPRRETEYQHPFRTRPERKPVVDFAKPAAAHAQTTFSFRKGDRIRHKTFGEGTLVSVEPMGGDMLLEVEFDGGDAKKLMASFAKLEKI